MEIIMTKSQADAYVSGMKHLGKKFNGKQINGKIEDVVKLNSVDGKLDLRFLEPVPEMVRIACYLMLIETLL